MLEANPNRRESTRYGKDGKAIAREIAITDRDDRAIILPAVGAPPTELLQDMRVRWPE